ncbi:Protein kinase [uncultured virus]|nr:Protein kinase [uncultured virus]
MISVQKEAQTQRAVMQTTAQSAALQRAVAAGAAELNAQRAQQAAVDHLVAAKAAEQQQGVRATVQATTQDALGERYKLISCIEGTLFGAAYLMRDAKTNASRVAKVFMMNRLDRRSASGSRIYDQLADEIHVMKEMKGVSGVVQLLEVIETKECTIIVMPYYSRGDLCNHIQKYRLSEGEVRHIVSRLFVISQAFIKKGLVHADISLENICILEYGSKEEPTKWDFVVIDLGGVTPLCESKEACVKHFKDRGIPGKFNTIAPESSQNFEKAVVPWNQVEAQVWMYGSLLFSLASREHLYLKETYNKYFSRIYSGAWVEDYKAVRTSMRTDHFRACYLKIEAELFALIASTLRPTDARLKWNDLITHKWFTPPTESKGT